MFLHRRYTYPLLGNLLGIALYTTTHSAYAEEVSPTPEAETETTESDTAGTTEETPWIKRYAPTRNLVELGIFAGILLPSTEHELYDPSLMHQPFRRVAPDIGLRFGYYPLSFLGLELEGAVMPTKTQDGNNATIFGFRGHALGQLPYRITPFVLVGIGLLGQSSSSLGRDVDPSLHFGGGLKFFINRWIALRLDARDHVAARYRIGNGRTHNVEILAGLSVTLNRAKPKPKKYIDTDQDGVYDPGQGLELEDQCVTEPGPVENKGCPLPKDRDGDGFIDEQDVCPDEPGVKPDGCPIRDTDGDGILDPDDKCVNEPETVNGFEDRDGCPDEPPQQLKKFTGTIRGIFFDVNKDTIKPRSETVLNQAVEVLKEFPDVRVEISGHTDSDGKYEYNIDLSGRRAESVKRYLVDHGIEANRLETVGYGPDKPIADNATPRGKAQNRRIEFRLLTNESSVKAK